MSIPPLFAMLYLLVACIVGFIAGGVVTQTAWRRIIHRRNPFELLDKFEEGGSDGSRSWVAIPVTEMTGYLKLLLASIKASDSPTPAHMESLKLEAQNMVNLEVALSQEFPIAGEPV